MKIEDWFSNNFESILKGRYITLDHIKPLLEFYKKEYEISKIGVSELGEDISIIKIGSGKIKVLAWSQMHGNESTTTKSLFDFFKFLTNNKHFKDEIKGFKKKYTLYVIPILNPDGARLYTRNNANNIDLNRDAKNLSQKESVLLMNVFKKIKPNLCLNLHGQRSIFGLNTNKPATISFLSPSSNGEREITASRKIGMKIIARMNNYLESYIPGQIGRYDDSFNENCFGDLFQMNEVPVILFEAGHIGNDYLREETRKYIFYSLLCLFGLVNKKAISNSYDDYFKIPENQKIYFDFIIRNVYVNNKEKVTSLAIQFKESLSEGAVKFIPVLTEIGELKNKLGHKEIDGGMAKILVNSQKSIKIDSIVSVISNENDKSLIYFDKNCFQF